jgi:hypothetical protein
LFCQGVVRVLLGASADGDKRPAPPRTPAAHWAFNDCWILTIDRCRCWSGVTRLLLILLLIARRLQVSTSWFWPLYGVQTGVQTVPKCKHEVSKSVGSSNHFHPALQESSRPRSGHHCPKG